MTNDGDHEELPGFVALDTRAVLDGTRRGASVVIDDSYFDGQLAVLDALGSNPVVERRRQTLVRSKELFDDVHIDFPSPTERNLWDASRRYRSILQQLPEVQYLRWAFPETSFVVPEWLRTRTEIQYGARVYFFRDADAPAAEDVLAENISATVTETRADFEQYQGELHGYPSCCIEFFQDRRDEGVPPEVRSMEPLLAHVDEDALAAGGNASTSIAELLPGLLDEPDAFAFFAREFFPEPECATAREVGTRIYDSLSERLPAGIVDDYVRLNVGWSYLISRGVRTHGRSRPPPGSLGREQLLFTLPLSTLRTLARYR